MRNYLPILQFWGIFLICEVSGQSNCKIDYDDGLSSDHHHSMIVNPEDTSFLYPIVEDGNRILEIPSGTVIAACPGPSNSLFLNSKPTAEITCKGGRLSYAKKAITWSELGCTNKPFPELEKLSTKCGVSKRGRDYTILWPINKDVIIPQITLCFDEQRETTLFTHHEIQGRNIDAKIIESSRPTFKPEGLLSVKANELYVKKNQVALLTRLLGTSTYLTGEGEHFLARGHLSPDSDFVLEPEQDGTYYYANVVPQWQAINNGNWKKLENSIRDLAVSHRTTLEIWTGAHGILQLPDVSDNPVELFLGLMSKKKVIPVPALMWKVVYDPVSRSAIAIVQVNDVAGSGSAEGMNLYEAPCNDICSEVSWVDWDVTDNTIGQTFCCSVQDLKSVIPNVPDLKNARVLKS